VLAEAKPEWVFSRPLAVHVEHVWVGEDLFIAVGALVGSDDAFAGPDKLICGGGWLVQLIFFFSVVESETLYQGLTCPPSSRSTLAVRFMASADAVWYRHSSSTNAGASDGFAFSAASCLGCWNKVTTPY
jgi:hypothetical protein